MTDVSNNQVSLLSSFPPSPSFPPPSLTPSFPSLTSLLHLPVPVLPCVCLYVCICLSVCLCFSPLPLLSLFRSHYPSFHSSSSYSSSRFFFSPLKPYFHFSLLFFPFLPFYIMSHSSLFLHLLTALLFFLHYRSFPSLSLAFFPSYTVFFLLAVPFSPFLLSSVFVYWLPSFLHHPLASSFLPSLVSIPSSSPFFTTSPTLPFLLPFLYISPLLFPFPGSFLSYYPSIPFLSQFLASLLPFLHTSPLQTLPRALPAVNPCLFLHLFLPSLSSFLAFSLSYPFSLL